MTVADWEAGPIVQTILVLCDGIIMMDKIMEREPQRKMKHSNTLRCTLRERALSPGPLSIPQGKAVTLFPPIGKILPLFMVHYRWPGK